MDMSSYVLSRVLSVPAREFQQAMTALQSADAPAFALAGINALLSRLTATELPDAIASPPPATLSPYLANYLAAMVETACHRRHVAAPAWTRGITALASPVFATSLQSLRLHLLTHSPAPFRRRNIFIDASVGDQV
ncbi:MAG: hypothetical protein JSR67_10835 [Proteobacteria bacterium]|nr:hypothetical protein [Pseudomonadota bacterium]